MLYFIIQCGNCYCKTSFGLRKDAYFDFYLYLFDPDYLSRVEQSYRSPSPLGPGERLLDGLDDSLLPDHKLSDRILPGGLPGHRHHDRVVPGGSSMSTGSSLLGRSYFIDNVIY